MGFQPGGSQGRHNVRFQPISISVSYTHLSDKCTLAACLLVFACSSLLNLLTFVYFAALAKRTGALPHRVFGLGRFFLEAGFLVCLLYTSRCV